MKKTLLLILPLLFIMSCDTDDDETSDGLVGTWTVESVTYYENGNCSGEGETDDFINGPFTGTVTYTEALATASLSISQSLSSYCDDADGNMVNDTTCIYDGDVELILSVFVSDCYDDGGNWEADSTCNFVFTNEWYYTYHEDSLGNATYCEIYYDEGESIDVETVCGSAVVSGNTAMLQIIEENDDNELECTVIMLSKQETTLI